jgi:hypothetical protein
MIACIVYIEIYINILLSNVMKHHVIIKYQNILYFAAICTEFIFIYTLTSYSKHVKLHFNQLINPLRLILIKYQIRIQHL